MCSNKIRTSFSTLCILRVVVVSMTLAKGMLNTEMSDDVMDACVKYQNLLVEV